MRIDVEDKVMLETTPEIKERLTNLVKKFETIYTLLKEAKAEYEFLHNMTVDKKGVEHYTEIDDDDFNDAWCYTMGNGDSLGVALKDLYWYHDALKDVKISK